MKVQPCLDFGHRGRLAFTFMGDTISRALPDDDKLRADIGMEWRQGLKKIAPDSVWDTVVTTLRAGEKRPFSEATHVVQLYRNGAHLKMGQGFPVSSDHGFDWWETIVVDVLVDKKIIQKEGVS